MAYKTLDDIADLEDKRVLVRVDLNLPVEEGRVTDDTRLRRILPTITEIAERGALPIILAHFGRPKGVRVPEMSLEVVARPLANALGRSLRLAPDCIGDEVARVISTIRRGEVLLLENVRFHPGEEKNDPDFVAELAAFADIYVNDAFSCAHRAHASTEGLARLAPAYAGRSMAAELAALEKALSAPERPVVAVVGGAKVSTKLDLIGNLLDKVDEIIIGGGMANTFLAAQGHDVGRSLCEYEMLDTAHEIMVRATAKDKSLVLPVDIVVAREFQANAASEIVAVDACPPDAMIVDAGPASVALIEDRFETAKTIVWNGPLGAFELTPFDAATNAAALKAAALTESGAVLSVAGGGDTVAALNASGAGDRFSYVSTAGGAFLEWLEGKTLPGVAALEANDVRHPKK